MAAKLGVRENLPQFLLLVLINAFVGSMVGLERSVLPLLAEQDFHLTSTAAAVSFLISFGLMKSVGNLAAGGLADRFGRKRVLLAGWMVGIPVPLIVIFAPSWSWIVIANALLGINQALCWSLTVIMKIDLAGPRRRGLATAANEWAGYVGVAAAAALTGYLASAHGVRPTPFYPGIGFALVGFAATLFVGETRGHVRHEASESRPVDVPLTRVFALTTWRNRALFCASQAGFITNLKDGVMWGLVPIYLSRMNLSPGQIGTVAAVYPLVWGFCQLATGPFSDAWGRKWMIATGMIVQAAGVALFAASQQLWQWTASAALIGLGTALVYPTLLAAVSDVAEPEWRGSALGVYRLWRDTGYAVAGAGVGFAADAFGAPVILLTVAGLGLASGLTVAAGMAETRPRG